MECELTEDHQNLGGHKPRGIHIYSQDFLQGPHRKFTKKKGKRKQKTGGMTGTLETVPYGSLEKTAAFKRMY